jgi:3-methyladenine DNA glycosylase AlkD
MTYKIKRELRKLSNKQILEDIKKYIKSSHSFYETRVPEFKVLAKRLHDEYSLEEFYRVFNRFWKSGYRDKMSLAIYTLKLYEDEFDLRTWNFLKPRLKEIKSWDKIDIIGSEIIGKILLKYPGLEREVIKMVSSRNKWFIRMGIMSTIPLIRDGNIKLGMKFAEIHINSKDEHVQKAVGIILNETGKIKPESAKKFILKKIHMPIIAFNYATEDMKELRALRKIKKLKSSRFSRVLFWREIKN